MTSWCRGLGLVAALTGWTPGLAASESSEGAATEAAPNDREPQGSPPAIVNDEPSSVEDDTPDEDSLGAAGENATAADDCVDDGTNYDADWYCSASQRVERGTVWERATIGAVFGLPTSDEANSQSTWSLGIQGQALWGNSWAQLGGFLGWSGGGLKTSPALRHGQVRLGPRGRLNVSLGPVSLYAAATLGVGMDYVLEPDDANDSEDDNRIQSAYFYGLGGPGAGFSVQLGRGDRSYKAWVLDVGAHHYWLHWWTGAARDLPLAARWAEVAVSVGGTLEGLLEPSR